MNDPLDQKLSAHFKARKKETVADLGFSTRVITALPVPLRRRESLFSRLMAWDGNLLVGVAVTAIALCLHFGGKASGLEILDTTLASLTGWLSLSSLGIVLGITIATFILLGDDEELLPSSWI